MKVNGVIQVWDIMWVSKFWQFSCLGELAYPFKSFTWNDPGLLTSSINSSDMAQKLNMMFKISQWITSSFKWAYLRVFQEALNHSVIEDTNGVKVVHYKSFLCIQVPSFHYLCIKPHLQSYICIIKILVSQEAAFNVLSVLNANQCLGGTGILCPWGNHFNVIALRKQPAVITFHMPRHLVKD